MSLLKTVSKHEVNEGTYTARVSKFNEVKAVVNEQTEDIIRQAYVAVELELDNTTFVDRLYAARIPYVMRCLKRQYGLEHKDIDLEILLLYAAKHPVNVVVTIDAKYGVQVDYVTVEEEKGA